MSEALDRVATERDQKHLADQLLAQAKEQVVELVSPDGAAKSADVRSAVNQSPIAKSGDKRRHDKIDLEEHGLK